MVSRHSITQVDIHNYMTLLGHLEDISQAFVLKRVGWLAAWNPCRPDGHVELALDRRDERQMAKVNTNFGLNLRVTHVRANPLAAVDHVRQPRIFTRICPNALLPYYTLSSPLQFTARDSRLCVTCQMLVHLSVGERGETWASSSFRWAM